jgi:hypothetical protein
MIRFPKFEHMKTNQTRYFNDLQKTQHGSARAIRKGH